MTRSYALGFATLLALAALPAPPAWADPDKDESGKGREKRDERGDKGRGKGGGDRDNELRKDVDEANRELRKAEEERDRELDKARAEADREGKPEKYDQKRGDIWAKYREKEAKFRGKLSEKHGRAYERDYDGPRDVYRRLPDGGFDGDGDGDGRDRDRAPDRDRDRDRPGDRDRDRDRDRPGDRGSIDAPPPVRGERVKYADLPPGVKRTVDRERGGYGADKVKVVRSEVDGRRIYQATVDAKGYDRVLVMSAEGRLIDDYRVGAEPAGRRER